MNKFSLHLSKATSILVFLLFLIFLWLLISFFPYEDVFLSYLDDISYFRETPLFEERRFVLREDIVFPDGSSGHQLSTFDDTSSLTGMFQLDHSLSLDGDNSIRLLASNDQHGFAKVTFDEILSPIKAFQFYVFAQKSDDLGDLIVRLEDVDGNSYKARLKGTILSDKWRFVWLSARDFSSPAFGDPHNIVAVNFDIEAVPESRVQVNIDALSYEDDRSFISSWNMLDPIALSLEKKPEENFLVFQSVPRDHLVLYNRVPEFQNGRITAEVSSPIRGATCGLSLQGKRTPAEYGIIFVINGPGTPSWRLWNFQPGNRELLANGVVENWIFGIDEPVWMSLTADNDALAVYIGKTNETLKLLGVYANPNSEAGLPGIASFDDSRCLFRDMSVEYDPL